MSEITLHLVHKILGYTPSKHCCSSWELFGGKTKRLTVTLLLLFSRLILMDSSRNTEVFNYAFTISACVSNTEAFPFIIIIVIISDILRKKM